MHDLPLTDENGRLAALRGLDVLDSAPEQPFDRIVALVRAVLDVPIATVTFVDDERQWFKAQQGLDACQTAREGSFCNNTIRRRAALVVEDAVADPRFADSPLVKGAPAIRAYAGMPLTTPEGYNVGALCAIDTRPRCFTPAQLGLLGDIAALVEETLQLRRIATSDQLTGALSRRGFMAAANAELARCVRHGRPAALVLLDIDHFKAINDAFGHPAGDAVLRELAARCRRLLRPGDLLGRIGGEEFALLLPETDREAAGAAVERIRIAIGAVGFGGCGDLPRTVTTSFGIAPFTNQRHAEDWIAAADAPLYAAKRAGRNRTAVAQDRRAA